MTLKSDLEQTRTELELIKQTLRLLQVNFSDLDREMRKLKIKIKEVQNGLEGLGPNRPDGQGTK